MTTPADLTVTGAATPQVPPQLARGKRRRRPSGEPPPLPHQLSRTGRYWLAIAVAALALCGILLASPKMLTRLTYVDNRLVSWVAQLRSPAATKVMRGIGYLDTPVAIQVAWLINLVVLVVTRRWRHLLVWLGATLFLTNVVAFLSIFILRPRPLGLPILGPWHDASMPSIPVAVGAAVLVNTLYALVPRGRIRQWGKWIATLLVAAVAFSRVYLAQDNPSDVLIGVAIGVTIPLVAFRVFVPNEIFPVTYRRGRTAHLDVSGYRGEAIKRALEDQLGLIPIEVVPFGLAGSGGSTPLRVKVKGDQDSYVFCKLYAANHLRSDRWYKFGRSLLYGGLEDEKAFNSVRRLVQYEDYALRLLYAAGLPVPQPLGIVEITPEREYLLVMEFFTAAKEIGEVSVDDRIIDQGLLLVRRLWEAGLAHRDIKPANLLVRDGRLLLIDSAFAQVRPSPWRQAVDLANMMLVLALRCDPARVYERAKVYFTEDEIVEAFAATRGLTMPSQLRSLMRTQGRNLHAEFKKLLPYRVRPIAIQRWSARRVLLCTAVLVGAVLFVLLAKPLLLSSPLS